MRDCAVWWLYCSEVAPNMLLMGEDASVVEEVPLDDNGIIETVEQDEHEVFTDDVSIFALYRNASTDDVMHVLLCKLINQNQIFVCG